MYEAFRREFRADDRVEFNNPSTDAAPKSPELLPFLMEFGGAAYRNGLYRTIHPRSLHQWNERISIGFPEDGPLIDCFGFDWLGRVFALHDHRNVECRPAVVMFEPGTGEMLEAPFTLETFHNSALVNMADDILAVAFYDKWLASGGCAPRYDEVIGYKKPLFVGGEDRLPNLELCNLDVYWHFSAQLIAEVRNLPAGTHISDIEISDLD